MVQKSYHKFNIPHTMVVSQPRPILLWYSSHVAACFIPPLPATDAHPPRRIVQQIHICRGIVRSTKPGRAGPPTTLWLRNLLPVCVPGEIDYVTPRVWATKHEVFIEIRTSLWHDFFVRSSRERRKFDFPPVSLFCLK